jgi:group I intron endonuclease
MYIIYEIKNKSNNWRYIGCSKNYKNRWKEHLKDLKNKTHHNIHLQRAWDKYGESEFEFNILLNLHSENIMFLEETKIIQEESMLYNIASGGSGGDNFSNNPNKEIIRKKMITANRKKIGLNRNPFLNLTPDEYNERCKIWSDSKKGSNNGRFIHDRKVKQIDKKTREIVKIYDYARLVIDDGFNPKYVIKCCNKISNFHSHLGFIWEWVE